MNILQPKYPASARSIDSVGGTAASPETFQFVYQSVLDFIRRQYHVIAFVAAITIAMGFIYVLTTPPSYTATATMIIDTKKLQIFQQQSLFTDAPMDLGAIESQVEILKSERIALDVIKKLHLDEDPEFLNSGGGLVGTLLSSVMGLFAFIEPSSEGGSGTSLQVSARRVLGAFQS